MIICGTPAFNPAIVTIVPPPATEFLTDQAEDQLIDQTGDDLTSQ